MKILTLSVILFVLNFTSALSQTKHDYVWLFGTYEGSRMDFNNKGRIDTVSKNFMITDNNCQISDKIGKLQFYFTGCRVVNSTDQIMDGGDSINYGKTWQTYCKGIDLYPSYQSSMIVPDPGNESEGRNGYYLIHKRYELESIPHLHLSTPEMYYSYIDMNKNNGKGKVIYKNRPAFRTTNINYGYMTGCKHANGRDWWILQSQRLTNKHFSVLLTADTIFCADSMSIGNPLADGEIGQATFTPDGSKYLIYNATDDCLIFDFDRSTGILSNYRHVVFQDSAYFTGIAVSPNSRFAYLCAKWDLFQIDLWADDIQNSIVHIDHWNGTNPNSYSTSFGFAQLAPDCKIYIVPPGTNRYIHVINKPDEKGKACDFRQQSVDLIKTNFNNSIPNYPHFRIDEAQICDSTITWIPDEYIVKSPMVLSVSPNPAALNTKIYITSDSYEYGKIRIHDINGNVIRTMDIDSESPVEVDTFGFVSGVYVVEYMSYVSGGRDVEKLVIIE